VIADLISGQIPMGSVGLTTQLLELHRTGKLRVLAVTSPTRLAGAPDFPTTTEAGLPGLVARGPVGLLAPAGTPRPIIDQIVQATHAALADRGYQQTLIEGGWEPTPDSSPEKFERMLADDVAHWTPLVKALALKID
jgi:tripartite-type tricarboxylate transporter receptor subunit TctC